MHINDDNSDDDDDDNDRYLQTVGSDGKRNKQEQPPDNLCTREGHGHTSETVKYHSHRAVTDCSRLNV